MRSIKRPIAPIGRFFYGRSLSSITISPMAIPEHPPGARTIMPPIVPETRIGKIEFYEAHLAAWAAHAAAIGLSDASVAALAARTAAARDAFTAHLAAQEAARSATQNFYNKVRAMHDGPGAGAGMGGADMIQTIKTAAQVADDPNIYVLARIPAPRPTHSALPPPGVPHSFAVELLGDGSVKLSWKCDNPGAGGTVYEIKRRIAGDGQGIGRRCRAEYIGASGVRSFVDDSLPAGTASATYLITAVRSTARGETAAFIVNFGVTGGVGQQAAIQPALAA